MDYSLETYLVLFFFIWACITIYIVKINEAEKIQDDRMVFYFAVCIGLGMISFSRVIYEEAIIARNDWWVFGAVVSILAIMSITVILDAYKRLPIYKYPYIIGLEKPRICFWR